MTLHRTALAAAIGLALLAGPAGAQLPGVYIPVERFAEVATGSWTTSTGVSAEYVSWTLPAGVRYPGVTIIARLHAVSGTGTGTAYLYSAQGASGILTASATLVASTALSVTDSTPDSSPYYTPTGLFSDLTLAASGGPVTYYLLLVPSNASLAGALVTPRAPTPPPALLRIRTRGASPASLHRRRVPTGLHCRRVEWYLRSSPSHHQP